MLDACIAAGTITWKVTRAGKQKKFEQKTLIRHTLARIAGMIPFVTYLGTEVIESAYTEFQRKRKRNKKKSERTAINQALQQIDSEITRLHTQIRSN